MQKLILQLLVLMNLSITNAQSIENVLGVYEYKDQTGVLSTMTLKVDSFIYRSSSMLEVSEVEGVWEVQNNKLIFHSNLQLSNHISVKEKLDNSENIKILLKDIKGIVLGKVPVILNRKKNYTYVSDSSGKIQIKNDFELESISIKYLSYPEITYQVKHKNFNVFELIFSPPSGVLYRYFEAESWDFKKGILIDKTAGFKKKYRKKTIKK